MLSSTKLRCMHCFYLRTLTSNGKNPKRGTNDSQIKYKIGRVFIINFKRQNVILYERFYLLFIFCNPITTICGINTVLKLLFV